MRYKRKIILIILCFIIFVAFIISFIFSPADQQFLETLETCVEARDDLAHSEEPHSFADLIEIEEPIFNFKKKRFSNDSINKAANLYIDGLSMQYNLISGVDESQIQDWTPWYEGLHKRSTAIKTLQENGYISLDKQTYSTYALECVKSDIALQTTGQFYFSPFNESPSINFSVINTSKLDFKNVRLNYYIDNSTSPNLTFERANWSSGEVWQINFPLDNSYSHNFGLSIDLTAECI